MRRDLAEWNGCPPPERKTFTGRYVRLEPLDAAMHGAGLFAIKSLPEAGERFRYLPDEPPGSRAALDEWLALAAQSADPMFFAVIDRASEKVGGRQTLMRITPQHGVVEIGNIYWSSLIARKPAATEAFYLFARHVFDDLGYRRFEWKCNNENTASKRAALRFGMTPEGVFRQAMVVKGRNRDTAWFSILDAEWPGIRSAMEAWLDPDNFDGEGRQKRSLLEIRGQR